MAKGHFKNARCLKSQPEFSALDKSRRFFLLGLTLLIFLFMGASIFYISTQVEVVGTGYEINQELAKKQKLIEENKLLSLEIAQLKAPGRLDNETGHLAEFQPPLPHQTIYLSKMDNNPWLLAMAELDDGQVEEKQTATDVQTHASKPVPVTEKKTSKKEPEKKPEKTVKLQIESEPKVTAPKTKKLILAKAENSKTEPASKVIQKTNTKKPKDAVPAVLLDPMP